MRSNKQKLQTEKKKIIKSPVRTNERTNENDALFVRNVFVADRKRFKLICFQFDSIGTKWLRSKIEFLLFDLISIVESFFVPHRSEISISEMNG